MKFEVKKFNKLSVKELYEVMQLREKIFVVEQNCVYLDADGNDLKSMHVLGYSNKELIAYARVVKPGFIYKTTSIGRVVIDANHRGNKLGYTLMEKAISVAVKKYHPKTITISAQVYLKSFYKKIGFESVGKVYLDFDLPHIKMIMDIKKLAK